MRMPRPQGGRKTNIDMTEGVIWKPEVHYAKTMIMGNVFEQLYNTVDSIVVNVGPGGCGSYHGDLQHAGELL